MLAFDLKTQVINWCQLVIWKFWYRPRPKQNIRPKSWPRPNIWSVFINIRCWPNIWFLMQTETETNIKFNTYQLIGITYYLLRKLKDFLKESDINFFQVCFLCLSNSKQLILHILYLNLVSFGLGFDLNLSFSLICVSVWYRFRFQCINIFVSVSVSVSVKILVSVDY